MACHLRSNSLPTKSHSLVLKAEVELQKLRGCVAPSSSLNYQMILDALRGVSNIYDCMNDLLCMSKIQNKRWVDQELDESIKLLDICSTSRDYMGEIKSHIQDLESAVRRCESESIKGKERNYIHFVKKAIKDVKKQANCKRIEAMDGDESVLGLLTEAKEITISLLQSIFFILSTQIIEQNTSKWSLVSIALQKRKVAGKEEQEKVLDIASLRVNVEGLENELEFLFRSMIRCRVSLLNTCSL